MRRTLFIVPADEAALFAAAAGRDIAAKERRKLEQWLAAELGQDGVRRWLAGVEAQVVEVLADGRELRTQDLTGEVSELGAGRSVPGTWARTETACSTATATPARPCRSMVASSAAGAAPRRRGGLPGAGGVGAEAAERVAEEAAALTDWLAGVVVASRFPTPLARELSG